MAVGPFRAATRTVTDSAGSEPAALPLAAEEALP